MSLTTEMETEMLLLVRPGALGCAHPPPPHLAPAESVRKDPATADLNPGCQEFPVGLTVIQCWRQEHTFRDKSP